MKKYGYMIKTVNRNMEGYNGFKYPEKGKVVAPNWDPEPICGGGIHGLIHETKMHYIQKNDIWLVLKYEKGTEVVIENEKIKVPYAWIVFVGTAEDAQKKFEELTEKKYEYDYAVQTAEYESRQKAGDGSIQIVGDFSRQKAGNFSIQTAGAANIQTAGDESTQIAGNFSTQKAGNGSVCIINGREGYCQHTGKVLQILRFRDDEKKEIVFLKTIIKDNKKYKLEAKKTKRGWRLFKKEIKNV